MKGPHPQINAIEFSQSHDRQKYVPYSQLLDRIGCLTLKGVA
jgi:hypothetical protein